MNSKKKKFVLEYLKDYNAKQSAIRAGYSIRSAASIGQRLLTNDDVSKEIALQSKGIFDSAKINAVEVLKELYRILTIDVAKAYNPDGTIKPIEEIPEDVRRGISSIEVDEIWEMDYSGPKPKRTQTGETKKIKFWSKTEAANLLGKHLKLWADKMEVNIFSDEPIHMTLNIKT